MELARPDESGYSRWVSKTEFVDKYASLYFENGASWCRASTTLAKKYIIEFNKSITPGPKIDAIRLNGLKEDKTFNQAIRADIKKHYKGQRCVILGIQGFSENTKIEIDHKDGRKTDWRVSNPETQKLEDFQPLYKAAHDVKRQICKNCKKTNIRWDATNIKGNPYPFYEGGSQYDEDLGCVGCYQYDPVEYRINCAKRIVKEASEHTSEYILKKLYPDDLI